jgi:flagellar motor switch protein FliM
MADEEESKHSKNKTVKSSSKEKSQRKSSLESVTDEELNSSVDMEKDTALPSGLQSLVKRQGIKTEHFPLLDVVIDKFHQYASSTLRGFFQSNVDVKILQMKSQNFGDYMDSTVAPSMFNVFTFEQWESSALMLVNNSMTYTLVNILFGGKKYGRFKTEKIEGRSFSSLELNLVHRFVSILLVDLSNAFSFIYPIQFKMERQETFPNLVGISDNNNLAIVCSLGLEIGDFSGSIDLVIPHISLDPIRDELMKKYAGDSFGQPNVWKPYLTQELMNTELSMDAILMKDTYLLSDVLGWKAGQVISVDKLCLDNIVLQCEEKPLIKGKLGHHNEMISIEIDEIYLKNASTIAAAKTL